MSEETFLLEAARVALMDVHAGGGAPFPIGVLRIGTNYGGSTAKSNVGELEFVTVLTTLGREQPASVLGHAAGRSRGGWRGFRGCGRSTSAGGLILALSASAFSRYGNPSRRVE